MIVALIAIAVAAGVSVLVGSSLRRQYAERSPVAAANRGPLTKIADLQPNQRARVTGRVSSATPLSSKLGRPAIAYLLSTRRQGGYLDTPVTQAFDLEDATGTIHVDPQGFIEVRISSNEQTSDGVVECLIAPGQQVTVIGLVQERPDRRVLGGTVDQPVCVTDELP